MYNKRIRNILILIFPFFVMVVVNEAVRLNGGLGKPYEANGIVTINSAVKTPELCSWNCHNNTSYCKKHHVKYLDDYFGVTDILYFGTIRLLYSSGNYSMANLVFLVVGFPLIMWYLLIRCIDVQSEIKQIKGKAWRN